MTPAEGVKRITKLFGKRAYWRDNKSPSSQEDRDERRARIVALREERQAVEREQAERLKALDWYQEMEAKKRALLKEQDQLGAIPYYRLEVGYVDEIIGAFHVRASGDNWADVVKKAEANAAAADAVREARKRKSA